MENIKIFTYPVVFSLIVLLVYLAFSAFEKATKWYRFSKYRTKYLDVIADLETLVVISRQVAQLVHLAKSPRQLDRFEFQLRNIEYMIHAVSQVPPFGQASTPFKQTRKSIKTCYEDLRKIGVALKTSSKSESSKALPIFEPSFMTAGCYFCSRPILAEWHPQACIEENKQKKFVTSCKQCFAALKSQGHVSILYFNVDSKIIHWSQVAAYVPNEFFWKLNEKKPTQENLNPKKTLRDKSHLKVVYSSDTKISSKDPER